MIYAKKQDEENSYVSVNTLIGVEKNTPSEFHYIVRQGDNYQSLAYYLIITNSNHQNGVPQMINTELLEEVAAAIKIDLMNKGITTLNPGDVLRLHGLRYYVPRLGLAQGLEKKSSMTKNSDSVGLHSEEVYRYEFQYTVKESDLPNPKVHGIARLLRFFSGFYQGEGSEAIGMIEGLASLGGVRHDLEDLAERRKSGGTLNILKAWAPGTGDVLRATVTVTANYEGGIPGELVSFTIKSSGTITLAKGESISGPISQSTYTKQHATIDISGAKGDIFVNERGYRYLSLEEFLYHKKQDFNMLNKYNEWKEGGE